MKLMFSGAKEFKNQDLSAWSVSKVGEKHSFVLGADKGNTEPIWNK
jgi:hypothetical protein